MQINYMATPGLTEINIKGLKHREFQLKLESEFKGVCDLYNENPDEVIKLNKSRKREFVEIRQISMTIFRRKYKCSFKRAGRFFNKDHATAVHAQKTVENLFQTDKYFQNKTKDVLTFLN